MDIIRVDENAERLVIGTLLTMENSIINLCDGFCGEYFHNPLYQDIYKTITKLDNEQRKIDLLTVSDRMKKDGIRFDFSELVDLVQHFTHNVNPYSIIVKEKAIEREMILLSMDIKSRVANNEDVCDVIFSAESKVSRLQENLVGSTLSVHVSDVVDESIASMNDRMVKRQNGQTSGIPTGLTDMDRLTRGWQKSDLVIIGARPAMGKTATALHLIKHAAMGGNATCVFSLEMGKRQLVDRLIVGESGVNSDYYNEGRLTEMDLTDIDRAAGEISRLPIYIDDTPAVSISYIKSRCRILHRQGKCDIVFIDYLGLMTGLRENNGNREQEISSISRGCKAIAKELNIPVILLSQLNRECEKRADKRPMLSDLRESGAIEQDADMVLLLHRPKYYGLQETVNGEQVDNLIEFIFAKNRNGRTGTIYGRSNESLTKMFDLSERTTNEVPY